MNRLITMSLLVFYDATQSGRLGDIISLLHFAIVSSCALFRNYNNLPVYIAVRGLNQWRFAIVIRQNAISPECENAGLCLSFVKVEAVVQRTHRQLGVLLVDDA